MILSADDHRHITEAIAHAEASTSGEISCVLAEEASHYREVPLGWAALAAMVVPPLGLMLGFRPLALAETVSGWAAAQSATTERDVLLALSAYAVMQAILFAATALIVSIPAVRRILTPGFLKRHRVGQSAHHHMAALSMRLGADYPFVLIYASRLDRKVEIVASAPAHRAVGEGPWRDAAGVMSTSLKEGRAGEGFVRAIEICGAALAHHFPASGEKHNALPDTLLET